MPKGSFVRNRAGRKEDLVWIWMSVGMNDYSDAPVVGGMMTDAVSCWSCDTQRECHLLLNSLFLQFILFLCLCLPFGAFRVVPSRLVRIRWLGSCFVRFHDIRTFRAHLVYSFRLWFDIARRIRAFHIVTGIATCRSCSVSIIYLKCEAGKKVRRTAFNHGRSKQQLMHVSSRCVWRAKNSCRGRCESQKCHQNNMQR